MYRLLMIAGARLRRGSNRRRRPTPAGPSAGPCIWTWSTAPPGLRRHPDGRRTPMEGELAWLVTGMTWATGQPYGDSLLAALHCPPTT